MKKLMVFIALIGFTGFGMAQTANETQDAIQQAQQNIQTMREEGIPTDRVENLLETSNNSYLAQKNFAEEGGTPDYSRAIELTQQITEIQERSLRASDRIEGLEIRLAELEETSVNLTEARNELEAARTDFENQRFEDAEAHVEAGYSAISEAQSAQTQIESFAAAQRQGIINRITGIADYIRSNPVKVAGGTVFLLLAGGLSLREFRNYRLIQSKKKKQIKKQVMNELITEIQEEYYMRKEGSQIRFETKLDRFEDLRRETVEDINVIDRTLSGRQSYFWDLEEVIAQEKPGGKDEIKRIEESEEEIQVAEETNSGKESQNTEREEVEETEDPEEKQIEEPEDSDDTPESTEDSEDEQVEETDSSEEEEVKDSDSEKKEDEGENEEEGYKCSECGKVFNTERGLHIHQGQMHEEEDGVACTVCGKVFDTERGMHIHRGEVHINR